MMMDSMEISRLKMLRRQVEDLTAEVVDGVRDIMKA